MQLVLMTDEVSSTAFPFPGSEPGFPGFIPPHASGILLFCVFVLKHRIKVKFFVKNTLFIYYYVVHFASHLIIKLHSYFSAILMANLNLLCFNYWLLR